MPNPDREIAAGDPLYVSLVNCFGDDISGNWTKSWNKHWNVYMVHRNLPWKLLDQEFHVHFISTSPHVSISKQFMDFKQLIEWVILGDNFVVNFWWLLGILTRSPSKLATPWLDKLFNSKSSRSQEQQITQWQVRSLTTLVARGITTAGNAMSVALTWIRRPTVDIVVCLWWYLFSIKCNNILTVFFVYLARHFSVKNRNPHGSENPS